MSHSGNPATRGTVHKPRGLFWPFFTPLRHRGFTWFSKRPPPPQKNTFQLYKKGVFAGRLFTSQKNTGNHYYLLHYMKEIRYNVNQSVSMNSGWGEKGYCERIDEAARARKRCAYKDSVSYMPGFSTVSTKK